MRVWVPTLRLVMVEQGTLEEVPIGSTTSTDLVSVVSDKLLEEANESVERAEGDRVVSTLLELDAERLDHAIQRLIREPGPERLRVVPSSAELGEGS